MKTKFVITKYNDILLCAVYEDDKLMEFIFPETDSVPVGSIYIGHIKDIAKNINAAFVDIGGGTIGYLPLDKSHDYHVEQDIMVQVAKEAVKTKDMVLTTDISLAGKYLALSADRPGIGISKKITSDETRDRLKNLIIETIESESEYTDFLKNIGVIVRTNAAEAPEDELKHELIELAATFVDIKTKAPMRKCYSRLYAPVSEYLARIRDSRGTVEKIVTDIPEIYEECKQYFAGSSDILDVISLYDDEVLPLIKLYSIETDIKVAHNRIVWLKSGGYLVIEHTEALTVIDVNTGKNIKGKNKEKVFLETNLEAIAESARQMRLRNISGIIIIDLINLQYQSDNKKMISALKDELKKDRVHVKFIDITPLGLAEITREKIHKSINEILRTYKKD